MRFHFAWILEIEGKLKAGGNKKSSSVKAQNSEGKLKGGGNKKPSSVKAQKETKKPKKEKETKEDPGLAQKSGIFFRGWDKRGGQWRVL
jgi:hypothetical protein